MSDKGLFNKYVVVRRDGESDEGKKHHECNYFVLDLDHDPHAREALAAYAKACKSSKPNLSRDLDFVATRRRCGCREAYCEHEPTTMAGGMETILARSPEKAVDIDRVDLNESNFRIAAKKAVDKVLESNGILDYIVWGRIIGLYEGRIEELEKKILELQRG